MSPKPCCLILSCRKPKYETMRKACWESTVSHIAPRMPVFYLFGSSKDNGIWIPSHPNVHRIIAPCPDYYEDIPAKMYFAYRFLYTCAYDYVIKLDENSEIENVPRFLNIIQSEVKDHDYIALKGVGLRGITEDITNISYYHAGKVHDTRLNYMPSILPANEFAGGPGYVITYNAMKYITKSYKEITLCEDYNLSACLRYYANIRVYDSQVIKEKLFIDKYDEKNLYDINTQYIKGLSYTLVLHENKPRNICIMRIHGGLGNQLFEIAAGLAYATRNDMDLRFVCETQNPRKYYWKNLLQSCKHRILQTLPENVDSFHVWKEPSFSYTEIPPFDSSVFLRGYFQSSRYFPELRNAMQSLLTFPPNFRDAIQTMYPTLFSDSCVVVHARRGDYLKYADVHTCLPDSYYAAAIAKMKLDVPHCQFIVMSDDMEYWRSSTVFQGERVIYFDEEDITCLFAMMQTKHHIIANSTFSWWGAFLSGSDHVIAPQKWFGPHGPPDWKDLYEPEWIIL